MSKMFKLLTAVLVLGFLVGCGGGGSSGGSSGGAPADTKLSIAHITSYFPSFHDLVGSEYPDSADAYKYYSNVSNEKVADFIISLYSSGFRYDGISCFERQVGYTVHAQACAHYDSVDYGAIELYLYNYIAMPDDALFTSIFGDIDADVSEVFLSTFYEADLSAEFDNYTSILTSGSEPKLSNYDSYYGQGNKIIGDLHYGWGRQTVVDSYTGDITSYSNWGIRDCRILAHTVWC